MIPIHGFDWTQGVNVEYVNGGEVKILVDTVRNLNYQAQLNWARSFGKHNVTAYGIVQSPGNGYEEVKFLLIVKTGHSVLLIIGRIGILLSIMVLIMVPRSSVQENRFAFFQFRCYRMDG